MRDSLNKKSEMVVELAEETANSIVDLDELFDSLSENTMPLSTRSSIGYNAALQMEDSVNTEDELFDAMNEVEFVPSDSRTEVFTESLEAMVGYSSLIRQLNESVRNRITFFMSEPGGSLGFDEARKSAFKKCESIEEAKKLFKLNSRLPAESLSFYDLAKLWDVAPRVAEKLWETLKLEGRKEFESGHLAANATFPTAQFKSAWKIAQYLGMRDSFSEEWKPRNGIEISLIDMLAQIYCQWQFWLEQTVLHSQVIGVDGNPSFQQLYGHDVEDRRLNQAMQMSDRFNRMYLRTLRQLRDLRRYSPVTINNPSQVNIATDGGKQVNVKE